MSVQIGIKSVNTHHSESFEKNRIIAQRIKTRFKIRMEIKPYVKTSVKTPTAS